MKKNSIFFLALQFILMSGALSQVKAQSTCAWAKKTGGKNEDWGKAVAVDTFGNVYYMGNFYSQTITFGTTTLYNEAYKAFNYGAEMFLVKYDSCGNLKWAKQAGGNSETIGTDIITDAAGNIYVSGFFNSDTLNFGAVQLIDSSSFDAFVVKYDSSGNALWAVQGKGGSQDRANSIAVDALNNVYVTGYFSSSAIKFGTKSVANKYGSGNKSVFIAKINESGIIQWVKSGGGDYDAIGNGIGTDAAGNVYVCGSFGSTYIRFGNDSLPLNGYYDIFVVKYNTNGTEQWLRTAGDNDNDKALSLASDALGNVYITGYIGYSSTVSFGTHSITNNTYSLAMFLAKYDANGTAQWARGSQGNAYSYAQGNDVTLDAGGNPNIVGFYNSDSLKLGTTALYNNSLIGGGGDTLQDIFAAKYKANGNLFWARTAGGTGNDYGFAIGIGANNGVYIAGEFMSPAISFVGIPLTLTAGSIAGDGDVFIANNITTSPVTPDICLVTVDSLSQNNIIFWDKTPYANLTDNFIVYREIATNNYQPIGVVPYDSLSLFVDTVHTKYFPNTGDPNVGTYRYKIAIKDTCGNYSEMSSYHNTIYITNNNGTFSWNPYTIENTANPVTSYLLIRDDLSNGNWHTVTSVSGTQQTITDPDYSTYQSTASWRVATQWSINCTATKSLNEGKAISSESNVYPKAIYLSVNSLENTTSINIFPNPFSSTTTITFTQEQKNTSIKIMNVLGEEIKTINFTGNQLIIEKEAEMNEGIYFVQITDGSKNVVNRKIVVQ